MATDAQSLLQQGKCYFCFDTKQREVAVLALLAQISVKNHSVVDVTPSGLQQQGKCYSCFDPKQMQIAMVTLLSQIASGSNSGVCIRGGVGAPVGNPPCDFSVYIEQPGPNFGLWLGDVPTGWAKVIAQGP